MARRKTTVQQHTQHSTYRFSLCDIGSLKICTMTVPLSSSINAFVFYWMSQKAKLFASFSCCLVVVVVRHCA